MLMLMIMIIVIVITISILVHGGEHVFPVLVTKGRQTETEPVIINKVKKKIILAIVLMVIWNNSCVADQYCQLIVEDNSTVMTNNVTIILLGSLNEDIDEGGEFTLVDLAIPVIWVLSLSSLMFFFFFKN